MHFDPENEGPCPGLLWGGLLGTFSTFQKNLLLQANTLSTLDLIEAGDLPLFFNSSIDRRLSLDEIRLESLFSGLMLIYLLHFFESLYISNRPRRDVEISTMELKDVCLFRRTWPMGLALR